MRTIPLFGSGIKSLAPSITAQRRLNCFYDVRPDQDMSPIIIRGTPGSVIFVTLPTFPIRGWRVVAETLYVVGGKTLYSVSPGGAVTALGTMPTTTTKIGISDNSTQIIIVDGVAGYIYDIGAATLTVISDGNFPNGAKTVTFLNSRFLVENPDSRQYYVSAQLDGTTWTPAIFGSKENYSDLLAAVDTLNGLLVLWGEQSIEFAQDTGATPNPYIRVDGATQTWGLAALYSRCLVSNTMIFLGRNAQGGVQILQLIGATPNRISTSDIENIISSFATYQDAVALTYVVDGHLMYQISFPAADRSFLYDCTTQFWSEVQTGLALIARHYAELGVAFNAANYVCDATTGNIYSLDTYTYTDNATPIKRQVASRHIRNAGNEFSLGEVYLTMEAGVGLQTGQGSDPQMMMQISRDFGHTFGPEKWRSIGKVGEYRNRAIWRDNGGARDMVLQFTMTDPVPFIINTASAVIVPGTEVGK